MGLFDYDNNDESTDDSLRQEEKEIRKQIENLVSKLQGTSDAPVTNEDVLQYVRVVNFNFATLSRLISTLAIKVSIIEDSLAQLHSKLDNFLESNQLIEDSLHNDDRSDE